MNLVIDDGRLWRPEDFAGTYANFDDTSQLSDTGTEFEWRDLVSPGTQGMGRGSTNYSKRPSITASGVNGRRTLTFNGTTQNLRGYNSRWTDVFKDQPTGWNLAVFRRTATDVSAVARIVMYHPTPALTRLSLGAGLAATANRMSMAARQLDGGAAGTLSSTQNSSTSWVILLGIMDWANGDGFLYVNGDLDATNTALTPSGNTSNTSGVPPTIGAATGAGGEGTETQHCNMELGQITFGRALPDASTIDKLNGQAAWHWGIQSVLPSLHPYKTVPPTMSFEEKFMSARLGRQFRRIRREIDHRRAA